MVFDKCYFESKLNMADSLMDMVITTIGVILVMILLSCLCCLFMKLSDLKLQRYILKTAKQKGLEVDLDKLDPKYRTQSPLANESCTIMVPDVAIVL